MRTNIYQSRKSLCRWVGWFFSAQVVLLFLICFGYLSVLPHFASYPLVTHKGVALAWLFTALAFVGQCSIFAFCASILGLIASLIFPRRWFTLTISILLATALALVLILDCLIYYKYHFHIEGIVWDAFRSGTLIQFFDLAPNEWRMTIIIVSGMSLILLLIEYGIALFVWKKLFHTKMKMRGWLVGFGFAAALFVSYVFYINVGFNTGGLDPIARSDDHLIVMAGRVIPYYNETLELGLPWHNPSKGLANLDNGYFVQNEQVDAPLQYPLHPLQCEIPPQPYNIVVIAIDTWRFDMLNAIVSPHIAAFAKTATNYANHYSGGNCTRPGIFSLFYGISPTYWSAMQDQKRGPVFIQQLLAHQYQMGVYGSASLNYPPFDQTVFRDVKNLQIYTPGSNSTARDREITSEFSQFVTHRDPSKPFFSFLFYDEVHAWCGSSQPYPKPFQPAIKTCDRMLLNGNVDTTPYLNRYKNAVYFVDQLVGKDLAVLADQHLLKNTIVIITSDHGEEFNDEHLNNWGHASAYDPYQVKTPFIVYWPNQAPKTVIYKTSHYDMVPTLLKNVLGCKNPDSDYSSGVQLATAGNRPFLIVGSYVDYAILQENRIITIYPGGDYGIQFANGAPDNKATLNLSSLENIFKVMNRFFKK